MTLEYALYAFLGIIVTAIVSVISTLLSTRLLQKWSDADENPEKAVKEHKDRTAETEKLIKEHEDRSKDNENLIKNEIGSLKDLIEKLKELIHEVRNFMTAQTEKNHNWTQQIDLLWLKHNEHSKEINEVKDKVVALEYKAKYGREYRKEDG